MCKTPRSSTGSAIALKVWYSNASISYLWFESRLRIINKDIQKAGRESIIVTEGVTFLNANKDHLKVVKVFPLYDLQVLTPVGFVLQLQVLLKHFKMYITITDIVGEKRISLAYLIQGKEVAVVSMFIDSVQYWIKEPLKVMLMNEEKRLLDGMCTDRELNASVGRKVIMLLDVHDDIVKMDKLVDVMEMVLSLDELDNTDNLENGRLSNMLLRLHVTGSDEFTCFEPVTPQYK